jgi:hypothetical protein
MTSSGTLDGVLASNTIVRAVYHRLGYAEQTLKLAKKALSPGSSPLQESHAAGSPARCGC